MRVTAILKDVCPMPTGELKLDTQVDTVSAMHEWSQDGGSCCFAVESRNTLWPNLERSRSECDSTAHAQLRAPPRRTTTGLGPALDG